MRAVDPPPAADDALAAGLRLNEPHAAAHARVERQLEMLDRLAEMGMRIAEATERWALAAAEAAVEAAAAADGAEAAAAALAAAPRGDPGLAFSRVARAVRLTLMLQTRLLKELPELGRAEDLAGLQRDQARRTRAHRLVERVIRAELPGDDEAAEALSGEAWERLRDQDLECDLAAQPLEAVVARICHDLGLSPDWAARFIVAAPSRGGPPPGLPPTDLPPPGARAPLRPAHGAPPGRGAPPGAGLGAEVPAWAPG